MKKVAILGTGDMGSAIAQCLNSTGLATHTCLKGRGDRSRLLATAAGMTVHGDIPELVESVDVFLSIIPPASAVDFANKICPIIGNSMAKPLFVDCNAVAPATTIDIAEIARGHGVRFQDAGIVGAAPRPGRPPVRLYTSGPFNDAVSELQAELIEVKLLGPEVGRASALKMVFASLTKGTNALRAIAILAGEQLDVGEEVRAEWQRFMPDTYTAMCKSVPTLASDSVRWAGEMHEIASTY